MEDYYRDFQRFVETMKQTSEENEKIKIKRELAKHGIELKELEDVPDHSPYEPF